jgi:flavin reductase ActVB
MPVSTQTFKEVQALLAGAVTIATTTRDEGGRPWGFTASSFCSLSLDPPLVAVCLARSADCYTAFLKSSFFAINVLSARQRHLSQRFATKGNRKYYDTQFEEGQLGVPLLSESLARLECCVQTIYPGGDHSILIGLVEHGEPPPSESLLQPLLYYNRSYGTFTLLEKDKVPAQLEK